MKFFGFLDHYINGLMYSTFEHSILCYDTLIITYFFIIWVLKNIEFQKIENQKTKYKKVRISERYFGYPCRLFCPFYSVLQPFGLLIWLFFILKICYKMNMFEILYFSVFKIFFQLFGHSVFSLFPLWMVKKV